jgi:hypothetical protein
VCTWPSKTVSHTRGGGGLVSHILCWGGADVFFKVTQWLQCQKNGNFAI